MEDIKWLLKKYGLILLVLLVAVIVGANYWEKQHPDKSNVSEEVWEPPIANKDDETVTVEDSSRKTSMEPEYEFTQQDVASLLSDEEQKQLQEQALAAAELVSSEFPDLAIAGASSHAFGMNEFTGEHQKAVVETLGREGLVSIAKDINMQNYEQVETFYAEYLRGKDSMFTVFEAREDGLIGAVTFIYRAGQLQTYYVGTRWGTGGLPEIQGTNISNVAEIKLTDKGYFIYAYETVVAHASLREHWRIKPLSEKCRALTEKYIANLSYVNYNMLVTNWNEGNVGEILMPCMYEDIYRIYTGENLNVENWSIPAEEYERIMTTCFPVSIDQLKEYNKYDEGSNSYHYEMIIASPHPPFGEVVDYIENADGTITLIVEGVWPDYNSDLAFTNKVVVQPFPDGTFRYLSNSIEQKELEIPSAAKRLRPGG